MIQFCQNVTYRQKSDRYHHWVFEDIISTKISAFYLYSTWGIAPQPLNPRPTTSKSAVFSRKNENFPNMMHEKIPHLYPRPTNHYIYVKRLWSEPIMCFHSMSSYASVRINQNSKHSMWNRVINFRLPLKEYNMFCHNPYCHILVNMFWN